MSAAAPTADETDDSCVEKSETVSDDLGIALACGYHSATRDERTGYVVSGALCAPPFEINTFSLKLTGRAAELYSAVTRCGYIRYDNGTFVGERVQVEARDGEWCDQLALQHIELADRMLLTDVSFAIEAKECAVPERHLAVSVSTTFGSTVPLLAETSLCLYVANRQPGAYTCSIVPPADYCECPNASAWSDFIISMHLMLTER